MQHAFQRGKYTSEGVFPNIHHAFQQGKYTSVYKILLPTLASTPLVQHDFRTPEMYIAFHSTRVTSQLSYGNDSFLSSPLRKHALERGKQIFLPVSHGQHALERGKHICAFCSALGQHALERGKYILLSVFLGLILIGQHAFRMREMNISFCQTWVLRNIGQ